MLPAGWLALGADSSGGAILQMRGLGDAVRRMPPGWNPIEEQERLQGIYEVQNDAVFHV